MLPLVPRGPAEGFHILVLGDVLGDTAAAPLTERSTVTLDVDNFDAGLLRLQPSLPPADADTEPLTFGSLDDFHPDALARHSASMQFLLELRRGLQQPSMAAKVIETLQAAVPGSPQASGKSETSPESAPHAEPTSPFEQLLGGRPAGHAPAPGAIDRLLGDLVAPYIVSGPDTGPYEQALNAALSEHLRRLLHRPDLQQLEAAWRGLWWLVSQLTGDGLVTVQLLPLSQDEFGRDLLEAGLELDRSTLFRRLLGERAAAGQANWSLLVSLHDFGAEVEDIRLLAALGALARTLNAPLVAGAGSTLAGAANAAELARPDGWQALPESVDERWRALRKSGVAPWLCLLLPRLLLRQPYGPRSDPIDSFEFEELSGEPVNEQLLWASPALAAALALGAGFREREWELDPVMAADLEDLPLWVTPDDSGGQRLQPVVETLLSERAAAALAGRGLTPLLAYRDRNSARLPGCLSLAGGPLAGRWG